MAGSATIAKTKVGHLDKYTIAWTSDAAGAVSANALAIDRPGTIEMVRFTPGAGGVQPTDLYDITSLNNAQGVNAIPGLGGNLSNVTPTEAVPVVSTSFKVHLEAGTLTPLIANAGNAKSGTIELLVRPL